MDLVELFFRVIVAIYALMFGYWLLNRSNEQRESVRRYGLWPWLVALPVLTWDFVRKTQAVLWIGMAVYASVQISRITNPDTGVIVFVVLAIAIFLVRILVFPDPSMSHDNSELQSADIVDPDFTDTDYVPPGYEDFELECKICNDPRGPWLRQDSPIRTATNSGMCLSCALISNEFTGCYPEDPKKGTKLFERYIKQLVRSLGGAAKFQERQHTRNRDIVSNGDTSVPRESEVLMRRIACSGSPSHIFVNWISVNPLKYQTEFLKPDLCVLCGYSYEWVGTGYKVSILNFEIGGWKHRSVTYADLNHHWPDPFDPPIQRPNTVSER